MTTPDQSPGYVRVTAFVHLAAAVALGGIRFFGERAPIHAAEWWIADFALAAIVAAPAVLALYSGPDRVLLVPAGLLSVGTSVLFFSGVGLPLIVPGVLYLVAYARRGVPVRPRTLLVASLLPVLAVGAAIVVLFSQHQIVCWQELRYRNGRTVIRRDRASERMSSSGSFMHRSGPPRADVLSEASGCTDGAVQPRGSIGALALVITGVAGAGLVTRR